MIDNYESLSDLSSEIHHEGMAEENFHMAQLLSSWKATFEK